MSLVFVKRQPLDFCGKKRDTVNWLVQLFEIAMQVSSVNKDLIRPAELWLYFKNDMQKFEKPVPSPIAVFFKDLQKSFS